MAKKMRNKRIAGCYLIGLVVAFSGLLGTSYAYWGDNLEIKTELTTGKFDINEGNGVRIEQGKDKWGKNTTKLYVSIPLKNDSTNIPIGDIEIQSMDITLYGAKMHETNWHCKWGGLGKRGCMYTYYNNRSFWKWFHNKGLFSNCTPSEVTPEYKQKTINYPYGIPKISIINQKIEDAIDSLDKTLIFEIEGLDYKGIEEDVTYISKLDIEMKIKCTSLNNQQGWEDIITVSSQNIKYLYPPDIEEEKSTYEECYIELPEEEHIPTILPELPEEEHIPTILPELPEEEHIPTILPELPGEEHIPTVLPELPVPVPKPDVPGESLVPERPTPRPMSIPAENLGEVTIEEQVTQEQSVEEDAENEDN